MRHLLRLRTSTLIVTLTIVLTLFNCYLVKRLDYLGRLSIVTVLNHAFRMNAIQVLLPLQLSLHLVVHCLEVCGRLFFLLAILVRVVIFGFEKLWIALMPV